MTFKQAVQGSSALSVLARSVRVVICPTVVQAGRMLMPFRQPVQDTMTPSLDPVTRLVRACEPNQPLSPEDPRYVNFDDVRGENVVQRFERGLRRADPDRAEVKLFAGHRGVGKTSELFRLKAQLEQKRDAHRGFLVVYFDVSTSLDVNDLDFPDLLVFAAAEVQRQLAAARLPGFSVASTYLRRVWDDILSLLGSEVSISGGEVEAAFAKLTLELRNRPNNRAMLRAAIERHSTSLLQALNDLLATARVTIREAGREGLVLVIDGLDKLVRRSLDDGRSNTHERLFIDRSDQLAALEAHTIYTVPISLIYSPRCGDLEQTFGEHNVPVSMIRLRGPDRSDPTADTPGMKKMREMLAARCRSAQVSIEDAFDDRTAQYLCDMSGGHPRHLMMFVQSAANAVDHLPITRSAAEAAVRHYGNSLLREVPDEAWPKLTAFAEPADDIPKDDLHQQMLFLLYVFEYMNGAPWYEVNPVLRTLPKFERSRGA